MKQQQREINEGIDTTTRTVAALLDSHSSRVVGEELFSHKKWSDNIIIRKQYSNTKSNISLLPIYLYHVQYSIHERFGVEWVIYLIINVVGSGNLCQKLWK